MKALAIESNIISNVPQKGVFKINASAHAFRILSSGLYSDKELAVVRELSTNAFDAHAAVGKQLIPFEIHLPTYSEPWFSVEDFGCGMTEEMVDDVYTTYFGSTKAETNEEAGFMGLGSKSPFSYTNSFTVQTIRDGVKLIYTMALSATGEPAPHLMLKQETDQANGTKVTVPVNQYDFNRFISAAKKVFKAFTTKPIVYGVDDHVVADIIKDQEYIIKNDVYGIRVKDDNNSLYAVQGPVMYPLDRNVTGLTQDDVCANFYITAFFPIGQLDPTASRESLSYDAITKANIEARFSEINSRIVADLQEYINSAPNLFEAYKRASVIRESSCIKHSKMTPMYKNKVIGNWGAYYEFNDRYMTDGFTFWSAELVKTRRSNMVRVSSNQISNQRLPISDLIYFFNDIGNKGQALYKKHIKETNLKKSYLVSFSTGYNIVGDDAKECMNWLMEQVPGINFIPLSSIHVEKAPRAVRQKSAGLPTAKEWKYIDSAVLNKHRSYREKLVPLTISESNLTCIAPRLFIHSTDLESFNTKSIIKLVTAECLDAKLSDRVYILSKSDYNTAMKGNVVWIHIHDFVKSMINATVIENIQIQNSIVHNNEILDSIHYHESNRKDSLILKMLEIDGSTILSNLTPFERRVYDIRDSLDFLDIGRALYEKSESIKEIDVSAYTDFCKLAPSKYPMLKFVNIKDCLGKPNEQLIMDYIELFEEQHNV